MKECVRMSYRIESGEECFRSRRRVRKGDTKLRSTGFRPSTVLSRITAYILCLMEPVAVWRGREGVASKEGRLLLQLIKGIMLISHW